MAPAKQVDALDCKESLSGGARRILTARLGEVLERRQLIAGPADSLPLHDLRIAAKRLRYSLEMFAPCFPSKRAESFADRVREMQDTLGRIHDLDVLHELLTAQLERMDEVKRQRELEVVESLSEADDRTQQLRKAVRDAPREAARIGLLEVVGAKLRERARYYCSFESLWEEWERHGLLEEIRDMIEGSERAAARS